MCMLALALFSTQPPGPPHTLSLAPTSLHFGNGPALSVPRGMTSPLATSPPTAASTPAASRPDSGTEASTPLSYRAWAAGATPSASRTSRGKPGLACLRWAKWAARKSLYDGERGEMEERGAWLGLRGVHRERCVYVCVRSRKPLSPAAECTERQRPPLPAGQGGRGARGHARRRARKRGAPDNSGGDVGGRRPFLSSHKPHFAPTYRVPWLAGEVWHRWMLLSAWKEKGGCAREKERATRGPIDAAGRRVAARRAVLHTQTLPTTHRSSCRFLDSWPRQAMVVGGKECVRACGGVRKGRVKSFFFSREKKKEKNACAPTPHPVHHPSIHIHPSIRPSSPPLLNLRTHRLHRHRRLPRHGRGVDPNSDARPVLRDD